MRESHSCPQASSPHIAALDVQEKSFSHLITGYASISETNRRQKHIPKISERNHAGTSFGKPFRTDGNCIHVKLQQNILASSYKRPTSDMAFPVADDEGFGQSQIPLPSVPPIKSANYLCFKLSSKQCLNCNLISSRSKGSNHERKVQFFLTLFKKPLTPPPFI